MGPRRSAVAILMGSDLKIATADANIHPPVLHGHAFLAFLAGNKREKSEKGRERDGEREGM